MRNLCRNKSVRLGIGACLALAGGAMSLSFAQAGTCLISGSTNRVAAASADKSLTGAFDSFSRDCDRVVFAERFRCRPQGLTIVIK